MATLSERYHPLLPLDLMILEVLPDEGSTVMHVYPDGKRIGEIKKEVGGGGIDTEIFSARLRVMHKFGLVERVMIPRSATAGWQTTKLGRSFQKQQGANGQEPEEQGDGD